MLVLMAILLALAVAGQGCSMKMELEPRGGATSSK